jgi:putative oxidoreductase
MAEEESTDRNWTEGEFVNSMKDFLSSTVGNRVFLLALRLVLGFLFVFASTEKIAQPEEFAKAILNYHLLPIPLVNVFAIVLPWVELVAGLLLLSGLFVRGSSLLLTFLLSLFTLAISISIARGLDISCGCFGTSVARRAGWSTLAEDVLMLAGSLVLCYFPSVFASLETYLRRAQSVTDPPSDR